MSKYSGADWLNLSDGEISPLGRRVADLLGQVYAGLYHLPATTIRKATWADPRMIKVSLPGPLATWDFNTLTKLVVLCHDAAIRCEISGTGLGYLKALFFQRLGREGSTYERHPTMEQAIERIRHALSIPQLQGPPSIEQAVTTRPAEE